MTDRLLARPSPVHSRLAQHSRTNAWRTWNGYTVAGALDQGDVEYLALKDGAALTDLSPLREYEILGDEAGAFLERLTTRPVAATTPGRGRGMFLCRDDGRVVSQCVILRRGDREFVLACETDITPWLRAGLADFKAEFREVSELRALLLIAGPQAGRVLAEAGLGETENQAWGEAREATFRGLKLEIARLGPWRNGFEIRVGVEDAEILWDRLMRAGKGLLRPIGFDTLERHRVLYGKPRQAIDFQGICEAVNPLDAPTPFDLAQGQWVDLDKDRFTGRSALRQLISQAPVRPVVRLMLGSRTVPEGARVLRGSTPVGWLTSCATCPLSGQTRAFAALHGSAEDWERLTIENRQGAVVGQVWPASIRKVAPS